MVSIQEHIYLRVEPDLRQIAVWLSPVLGAEFLVGRGGGLFISRPARAGGGAVGGEIYANTPPSPDDDPAEESLLDLYPVVFEVSYTGRSPEIQLDEARRLFDELARAAS